MMRLVLLVALILIATVAVQAATIHVPSEQPTIQAGIDAAVDGDFVVVAPGQYTGTGNRDIYVTKSVSIVSEKGSSITAIDCQAAGRGFVFPDGTSEVRVLDGFTIVNGRGTAGGGIFCGGENVTIRDCLFEANVGGEGGAVALVDAGSVAIENCYFVDNIGTSSAGAVYIRSSPDIIVSGCVGWHNTEGGSYGGGFLYACLGGSNLTILNNTIVGNAGVIRGAGITLWGVPDADIRNNIVAFNEGAWGIFLGGTNPGFVSEYNDVYGNEAGDCANFTPGTGSISVDPLFADTVLSNFSLLTGSPCVDTGDPDPQYNDRNGTRSDLGALPYNICQPGSPDSDSDGVCDSQDICPGFYDHPDDDGDTVPDGCDVCPGYDDFLDNDSDGVPDGCDICPGADDNLDQDTDGYADGCDNCPTEYNSDQNDSDSDGVGDICDVCPFDPEDDIDDDSLCADSDNCPAMSNQDQADSDSDGFGNACDICDGFDDSMDSDNDGVPNGCDLCEGFDDNPDSDGDGVPDGCDKCDGHDDGTDTDTDGVPDGCDICEGHVDTIDADGDGVPDGCDICVGHDDINDQDGDLHPDGCDNCPELYNASQADADSDGLGNACDPCMFDPDNDVDGDGLCVSEDNCPNISNPGQDDADNDDVGDACDLCPGHTDANDADEDSIPDGCDICPGSDDLADGDGDSVPDGCDACPDHDDFVDADGDTIPDGCDICAGHDDLADSDDDGMPDGCDICAGHDDSSDDDSDTVPDGCDVCPGADDFDDDDSDTVPDACDICTGHDDLVDSDTDMIPDGCDLCEGFDDAVDYDEDSVPDGCDRCPGLDDLAGCPGVTALTVEAEESPQNVTSHFPRFDWAYDGRYGFSQSQYEIGVGTDSDWSTAEMWESGISPGTNTGSTYQGATLEDGATYYLRLRLGDDLVWSGWYEMTFRMNSLPSVPDMQAPSNGSVAGLQPTFYAGNSSDAEGDALEYYFEVALDAGMLDLVEGSGLISEETGSTAWTMTGILDENQVYFWRCRAYDGHEYGEWTMPWLFYIDAYPEAPSKPMITAPVGDDLVLYEMLPVFEWTEATDPDPFDLVRYRLELALDSGFTFVSVIDDLTGLTYQMIDSLTFDERYWWRVLAVDQSDLVTSSDAAEFQTWSGTCCVDRVGNANGLGGDEPTIGDISVMIDAKFITGTCHGILECFTEADVNQSGGIDADCDDITISDISTLIDYLFITGPTLSLPECL